MSSAHHIMDDPLPSSHHLYGIPMPWPPRPAGALLVGIAAGVVSVVGFAFLTPLLERLVGLGDTCGVHNLHGIPGILGGLVRSLPCWRRARELPCEVWFR